MIYYESKDLNYSFKHTLSNTENKKTKHELHNHNGYELIYLLDGSVEYNIEGECYDINKGDIIIVNCNEFHSVTVKSGIVYNRMVIEVSKIFLHEFTSDVNLFSFFQFKKRDTDNVLSKTIAETYNLDKYFFRLSMLTENSPENELRIKCVLTELFLDINKIYSTHQSLSRPKKSESNIKKIIEYINEELTGNLSLEKISSDLFISKYHLCHLFKTETGISISRYITTKRIYYANELIQHGTTTIDACYKCGFNEYSTFYRAFKRVLSKSPSA